MQREKDMTMLHRRKSLREKRERQVEKSKHQEREWVLSSHGKSFVKLTLEFMSHNISSVSRTVHLRCCLVGVHHS